MENGMDPRLALGAAEQQELAARRGMAENLAQGGADDEARRAKMRQACEGFESIFIQKMWEQMRATLPKEGLMKSKEEEFWMSMFFASGKYLLDILYGLEFSRKYQDNLVLNQKYEKAGEKSLWGLNEES